MSNKKFNGFGIASIILWSIIVILIVIIIFELVGIMGSDDDKSSSGNETAISTQSANKDQTEEPSSTSGTNPSNTQSPGNAGTNSGNAGTTTPGNSSNDGPAVDADSADIKNPSSIDYSFLANASKDNFEDCSDGSFDWYPGKVERNSAGEVNYVWDRYDSTLSILEKNGGIYRQNADQNSLYLTFDCGYENGNTAKILDTLKEKNVKGIFFVTGGFLQETSNHELLKRMYNEGHFIGNHTENHKIMPTLSNEEFVAELNSVYAKCKEILGDDFKMSYYRPPQGASCERDLVLANYLGYKTVFWSVTHADYNPDNQPAHDVALKNIKGALHPGAVYLLHAVSSTNAAILGEFIDYCISEGFTFKRMDQ